MEAFSPDPRRRTAETMSEHARDFAERGWMLGTSGNVSCRLDGERMLVSTSGGDKGGLTPHRFVVCDLEGEACEAHPDVPSTDAPLHGAIYEAFETVGALYHVHHLEATLCSEHAVEAGATTFRAIEMLKALGVDPEHGLDVPLVDNATDRCVLANRILRAVEPSGADERPAVPGVNVHRHGLYVWGDEPRSARRHVEALAYLFEHRWERIAASGDDDTSP
jgi:methylthioribulose-1-phosphate dehydratase